MATAPKTRSILKEELREAPSWVERLLQPINEILTSYNAALNKGLTFQDNITCTIKSLTVTTSSDYVIDDDFETIRFTHGLSLRPFMCLIAQIQKKADNYEPILLPVSLSWREENGQIVVEFITGLDNLSTYDVSFLVA
jgi:hypothetical protein